MVKVRFRVRVTVWFRVRVRVRVMVSRVLVLHFTMASLVLHSFRIAITSVGTIWP